MYLTISYNNISGLITTGYREYVGASGAAGVFGFRAKDVPLFNMTTMTTDASASSFYTVRHATPRRAALCVRVS